MNDQAAASTAKLVLTADTLDELKKLEQDIIAQGWHAESAPFPNPNGSYSVNMAKG
ncbi:MAG: hypothetical protein ABI840_04490 [bacterium]